MLTFLKDLFTSPTNTTLWGWVNGRREWLWDKAKKVWDKAKKVWEFVTNNPAKLASGIVLAGGSYYIGETTDFLNEHESAVQLVEVPTVIEVPGPTVTVPEIVYVDRVVTETKIVEVPGPVVTVTDVRVEVVETERVVVVPEPFPVPEVAIQTELVEVEVPVPWVCTKPVTHDDWLEDCLEEWAVAHLDSTDRQ
jgi:hypothetical protein